jgi:hypothetical protein
MKQKERRKLEDNRNGDEKKKWKTGKRRACG